MKKLAIVFLISFLVFSCNGSKTLNDEENIISDSDTAEIQDDDGEKVVEPKCIGEWEKIEWIEDVDTLFDFKIEKRNDVWEWESNGEYEKLDYSGSVSPVHIFDDGMMLLNEFTELEDGYAFMSKFKNDKTVEKFVVKFKKGETIKVSGQNFGTHLFSSVIYDESVDVMTALLGLRSKNGKVSPLVVKINSKGDQSYFSWETEDSSYCSLIDSKGKMIFAVCRSWEDGETDEKIEVYALSEETVYKKTLVSGNHAFLSNLFVSDGKVYIDYHAEVGDEIVGEIVDEMQIIDKDLCSEVKVESDFFLTDYFRIKEQMLMTDFINVSGDYSFLSGTVSENMRDGDLHYSVGLDFSYLNYYDREIFIAVGDRTAPEEGESSFYSFVQTGPAIIIDGKIFKTGSATFDIEGKGRSWVENEGTEVEETGFKAYLEYIDPDTLEVYVRHFIFEGMDERPGQIIVKGDDLFYKPVQAVVNSELSGGTALFKIPKTWLINEDSKVKDSIIKIVEKDLEREDIKKVEHLSGGGKHSCSINEDGRLFCWGENSNGQMGDAWGEMDTMNEKIIKNNLPGPVDTSEILIDKKVIDLSAGYLHSCAVDEDGVVFCWGFGRDGQLGNGIYLNVFSPVISDIYGDMKDKKIVAVSAGGSFSCAVDEDGLVYCWGLNLSGQLGDGTNIQDREDPMPVDMTGVLKDRKIVKTSSGSSHTCVLDDLGEVFCWGLNDRGQLGDGEGGDGANVSERPSVSRVPVKIKAEEIKFADVSAGYNHTCLLSDKGKIYCFGDNSKGQLGDKTTEKKLVPVAVSSDKKFKAVSAGFEHSCAIDDKDEAYCWGSNIVGQLGTGTEESSLTPVKVEHETETKVRSISCGHRHTCSVSTEGMVLCWGWNHDGQLGNGTYEDSLLPKEIKTKE
ncbi:MAG TPA: hypothetical protein VLJ60_02440 [bacterium]|nr:hypothetical protein [bacterium]